MALTDTTVPYEVLIRYNPDGSVRGAYVQMRRIVMLDGEVLKNDPLDAEPLSVESFDTSAIMTDTARSALVQLNVLSAELEAAQAAIEERDQRLSQLIAASAITE